MAGVFAIGGILAEPAATGLNGFDALLRAALCAGVVVIVAEGEARSEQRRRVSRWMLVAAAGLALLTAGLSTVWLAGAGFGVALGAASARLNARILRALSAGMTAEAALRLGRPGFALGTALVAAGVFALLLAGGALGLGRQPRRQSVRIGLAATGAAALVSAFGVLAVVLARPDVEKGVSAATAAVAGGRVGDTTGAATGFNQAAGSFRAASGRLGSWWARPAMVVPVVARHSRALRAMARSGSELSDTGAQAAREAGGTPIQLANGAVPLDRIVSLQASARGALVSLTSADARLGEVRSPWLISPVSSRLDALSERVDQARRDVEVASAASEVAPAMLGADRPRRYFVALQTPVEERGSGGYMGNFGEISADRGRLRLERLGRSGDLSAAGNRRTRRLEGPPDYVARYSRFVDPKQPFANVNMSPHFPSVGQAMAGLYPQSGGRPVDGVIAVDPIGLAALLWAVGPVQVKEWPVPITAQNAEQVLLFDQYVRYPGDERVDFLSRFTDAVWQRLTTSSPGVVDLARALSPVIAEKHIQLFSTNAGEEQVLDRLGVAGAMAPVQGDFLGVVTQNATGNKMDWFLRREVDYRARFDPGSRQVRSTARVTLRNQAPTVGLPDYLIGSSLTPPPPKGVNRVYLSIYTPLGLSGARVDGRSTTVESDVEQGRSVFSVFVVIPAGGSAIIELDLKGRVEENGSGAVYHLDLHRQPFLAPDTVTTSLDLAPGWRADQRSGGRDGNERLELRADRRMRVDVSRTG
jgi:hypothetical protein